MKEHSDKARKFYNSKDWRSCREFYIGKRVLIDGGLCEACKDRLGYIVDHIVEIDSHNINNPYITLNHDNLQYLCIDCHNKKTFGDSKRMARFDSDGNPIFNEVKTADER